MIRTSNPTLKDKIFEAASGTGVMTLGGTLLKTGVLFLLMVATAIYGWQSASMGVMLLGAIGGLILALVTSFKPDWSPVTAPLYALFKGLAVGAISAYYSFQLAKTQYAGAVPMAIMGTLLVLGVMLALYSLRIIRVTKVFSTVVIVATACIALLYLVTFFGSMIWPGLASMGIYGSGPIGLVFSAVVIVVAAMNLALDFQTVENGIQMKAPRYMEWYAGFGLLVTLVWIYLEILRLIAKLSNRR